MDVVEKTEDREETSVTLEASDRAVWVEGFDWWYWYGWGGVVGLVGR